MVFIPPQARSCAANAKRQAQFFTMTTLRKKGNAQTVKNPLVLILQNIEPKMKKIKC
jgi:hypothetical protein